MESVINECIAPLSMSEMPSNLSGPLLSGEFLFVVTDEYRYSQYPVVEIVKLFSANTTFPLLDNIFNILSTIGIPNVMKTDNRSPFNSSAFSQFAGYMGFEHCHITPHWPRANTLLTNHV